MKVVVVTYHDPSPGSLPHPTRVFMGDDAEKHAEDWVSRCSFPAYYDVYTEVELEVT